MKQYEVAVLLHPDLEIDLEAPLERLDKIFADLGAKVEKRDEWGKRKLAYPIENQSFAIYFFYQIELDPSQVTELEEALRLSDEVIRHLVVVYEPPEEKDETEDEDKSDKKREGSK